MNCVVALSFFAAAIADSYWPLPKGPIHKTGIVLLSRSVLDRGSEASPVSDELSAWFYEGDAVPLQLPRRGSCRSFPLTANVNSSVSFDLLRSLVSSTHNLDAGTSLDAIRGNIRLKASGGDGVYRGLLGGYDRTAPTRPPRELFFDSTHVAVRSQGGTDVHEFAAVVSPPVELAGVQVETPIRPAAGVNVSWHATEGLVFILLSAADQTAPGAACLCAVAANAGSFHVPAGMLKALPQEQAHVVVVLQAQPATALPASAALDAGWALSAFIRTIEVSFR